MTGIAILTAVLGVLGFVIAFILLLWQFWTYHNDRKDCVHGSLSISSICLNLDIWNAGQYPVYLKSVTLQWGPIKGKLVVDIPGRTLGWDKNQTSGQSTISVGQEFQPYPEKKGPLQRGEPRHFICPVAVSKDFTVNCDRKVWVSVKSPKGEVLHIETEELRRYLQEIAKEPKHAKGINSDN